MNKKLLQASINNALAVIELTPMEKELFIELVELSYEYGKSDGIGEFAISLKNARDTRKGLQ